MVRPVLVTIALAAAMITVAIPAESAPAGVWMTTNFTWATGGNNSLFGLRLTDDAAFGVAGLDMGENVPGGGLPLAALNKLSFDVFYVAGGCGGGSPRVSLQIDTNGDGVSNGNLNGYAGQAPSFTNCASGVWTHENLLDNVSRFEAQQLGGGWGITLQQAQASLPAGSRIVGANFIWDSAWAFPAGYQIVIDNLRVNGAVLAEPGTGEACSVAAVNAGLDCL